MKKKINYSIMIVFTVAFIFIQYFIKNNSVKIKSPYYSTMIMAQNKMKTITEEIKKERIKRGYPIDKELDIYETGLIGESWSGITTTLGNLESKRLSINPHFAALMVKLFEENNLKKGDFIAVNLSSSFPALNLAVIVAADSMGLNAVMVNSVGASTYGANLEDFTYLDMENFLFAKKLIKNKSSGFSLGGSGDTGNEFEEEIKDKIIARNKNYGLKFFYNKNLKENIDERYNYFIDQSNHKIKAFINIGGNLLSIGNSVDIIVNPKIILDKNTKMKSGLVGKFLQEDIPVFYLLNLKGIASNYNLSLTDFDSNKLPDIYYQNNSNLWNYVIVVLFIGFMLHLFFQKKY